MDSEEGKGSTFTLQFPATTEIVSPEESPEPEQEIKANSLRILVVDDDEETCNILDKFLSGSGHKVEAVGNGAGAIEMARRKRFDLVLCDVCLYHHSFSIFHLFVTVFFE